MSDSRTTRNDYGQVVFGSGSQSVNVTQADSPLSAAQEVLDRLEDLLSRHASQFDDGARDELAVIRDYVARGALEERRLADHIRRLAVRVAASAEMLQLIEALAASLGLSITGTGRAGEPPESGASDVARIHREVPIAVYLDDGTDHENVEIALDGVLKSIGLDVAERQPPIRGSWLRFGIAKTKKAVTAQEVKDQLAKIERALQMPTLLRPQAEIDNKVGDAVAKLITSLAHEQNAIIQAGSILLIKEKGNIKVRNLTQVEMAYLERNPRLLMDPSVALHELQRVAGELEPASGSPAAAVKSAGG